MCSLPRPGFPTPPPKPGPASGFALDLPRENRRSYISPRAPERDDAGTGYELVPGLLKLLFEDGRVLGEAVRMSATTVWFEPAREVRCPYGQTVRVSLDNGLERFGPFTARIGVEAVGDDVRAAARMQHVPLADGQRLVGFLFDAESEGHARPPPPKAPVQTDITDPVRLRVIVEGMRDRSAAARVLGGGSAHAVLVHLDEAKGRLLWSLLGQAPLEQGPFEVEVDGYNSVFRLMFDAAERTSQGLVTGLPSRAVCFRYRRFRRAEDVADALVRFEHPLWPELPRFERPLVDVSFAGIAFPTRPIEDALYIGLRIDHIEIVCQGDRIIDLRGTVRSLAAANGATTCGVSVEPKHEDAFQWTSFVMNRLNQTTSHGEEHTGQLWDLFTDSGYFSLSGKSPREFESLQKSFRGVMERTKLTPWLSFHSVWPSETRIEASFSATKTYARTWTLHQLAKRKVVARSSRQILRDTHLRVFEHIHVDPRADWLLCYVESHVRWTKRAPLAFASQFASTGLVVARPFRLMEASCHVATEITSPGVFTINRAGLDERRLLAEVLERTLPLVYREGADLVEERLDLDEAKRFWRAAGLERDREIWVARKQGCPVAAAVLEVGETGTNLFRLLDSLRLIVLQPGGEAAFPSLVEKARGWFLSRNKDSFVYFCEHPDPRHVELARFRDLGEGYIWGMRTDFIPDYLELVCELLSDRGAPESGPPESIIPGTQSIYPGGEGTRRSPPDPRVVEVNTAGLVTARSARSTPPRSER